MTVSENQHGYIHRKDDYLKRLRRIEGQARGLQRMVEEEQYCIDILTQVSAMTKALHAVSLGLLEEHLGHCVVSAARSSDEEAEHGQEEQREHTESCAASGRAGEQHGHLEAAGGVWGAQRVPGDPGAASTWREQAALRLGAKKLDIHGKARFVIPRHGATSIGVAQ